MTEPPYPLPPPSRQRGGPPAFEAVGSRDLPALGGTGLHLVHRRTGAEVVAVRTGDRNNVLAISFATLPGDDTGVAHILEHLVFRGSRAYPLSRPFAELLQGSLHSHLNASTGPDVTTFQLASRNGADLRNLVDVTLDAVLRPLLREEAFAEEAWHVRDDGRLGGVVLTEMEGHLAAPENRLAEALRRGLLPGTVYARAHGGEPGDIPRLTPRALRAFHRRHYHPSNARVFLWGDGDLEARLEQLDRHLAAFGRAEPVPRVPRFAPFEAPRQVRVGGPEGHVGLAWALPEGEGPLGPLGWRFLALALSGLPGAPLAEALDRAGLGRGLPGTGLETAWRQPVFRLMLRGVRPGAAAEVEGAALETVGRLAREGVEPALVEAALAGLELRLEEGPAGTRPRGLAVLDRVLGEWRHGGEPLRLLDHGEGLARLREGLADGQAGLREMLRAGLAENPHRLAVALGPGPGPGKGRGPLAGTSPAARRVPRGEGRQGRAVAAALPLLARSDLPDRVTRVPAEAEGRVLRTHLGERRVVRADLTMDLSAAPAPLLGLGPMLARLWFEGAAGRGGRLQGAISTAVWARRGPAGPAAGLVLRGRALVEDRNALFEAMAEALDVVPSATPETMARALEEEIARLEARQVAAAHQLVELRLGAGADLAGAMADRLEGLGQLDALRAVRRRLASDAAGVTRDLLALRRGLLDPARRWLGLSGPGDAEPARMLLTAAGGGPLPAGAGLKVPSDAREGHVVPASAQSVGQGADLRAAGLRVDGATTVGVVALGTGWLWEAVRTRGGAYGARAGLDRETGRLRLLSARDPHVLRTLDAYAGAAGWLRREAEEALVRRCVIGAVAQIERVPGPEALALEVLQRHLVGLSDDHRQAELEEALSAGVPDLLRLADALEDALPRGPVAVLGPGRALRDALAERPGAFTIRE